DGIRDRNVTGVQTCALPIYRDPPAGDERAGGGGGPRPRGFPGAGRGVPGGDPGAAAGRGGGGGRARGPPPGGPGQRRALDRVRRSEERRVGKAGRSGWGTYS